MISLVRIKICGITRLEDALICADLGVDALGFVFYEKSKRYISPEKAAEIIAKLPPFVTTVGLFVDASKAKIQEILQKVPLQLLQFHGQETEKDCMGFDRPYIKAIAIKGNEDFHQVEKDFASASALLYDGHSEGAFGGTGKVFEWTCIPSTLTKPWVLAGGLTPDNIEEAIAQTHAKSVDVSSGVEREVGVKDKQKIQSFISGVRVARL